MELGITSVLRSCTGRFERPLTYHRGLVSQSLTAPRLGLLTWWTRGSARTQSSGLRVTDGLSQVEDPSL